MRRSSLLRICLLVVAFALIAAVPDSSGPALATSAVLWSPNPGPQTEFLKASEFEVLYGGAAGGGKSDALMFGGLRYVHRPTYRALFLRESYPELVEMMDRSIAFKQLGAVWNEGKKRWKFPSGAVYEFGFFQEWKHHTRYQGQEYQYIAWDELGVSPEERRWEYLTSRCRSKDPEIPSLMRGSANPGGAGHAWLKRRFLEKCGALGQHIWADPKTGLTRRFVPARLADNPVLDLNDPSYRKRLEGLPDVLRAQLLEGDWGASSGLALGELDRRIHLIEPFPIPKHWGGFLSMDWGFAHPTSIGFFRTGPEKLVVLQDALRLHRHQPVELIDRINEKLGDLEVHQGYTQPWSAFWAGHDCWADVRARGEDVPTIAEQFARAHLPLQQASISRVAGLNNMRDYITLRDFGGESRDPRFVIFSTPGGRHVFSSLESMVTDPNDMEDSLKINADEYGVGGDDDYDMVRYGLASRPIHPKTMKKKRVKDRNFDHRFDDIMKLHPANPKSRRKRGSIFR